MVESVSEYHRRRSVEERAEADLHADDITADRHRRLAVQHRALAREAENAERLSSVRQVNEQATFARRARSSARGNSQPPK
jgi:hypothetical protein